MMLLVLGLWGCEPFQAEPLVCGGALVDPQTDSRHCGGCGAACVGVRDVAEGRCVVGRCVVETCAPGFLDQNGDPADGCEAHPKVCDGARVDVESDPAHCGGCRRSCDALPFRPAYAGGVACEHGVCVATSCAGEVVDEQDTDIGGHTVHVLVCGPRQRPPQCRKSDETCDGFDDDCDERVDEDVASVECGVGRCRRSVPGCDEGAPGRCVPGAPEPEACNGEDDDCDGHIDEGLAERDELCNGEDDDCDGVVDEAQAPIHCGLGRCASEQPSCVDGQRVDCPRAADLGATGETCNGEDDDCDGTIDEALGREMCGVGACHREVDVCRDGAPHACEPGPPGGEVCNGEDDDCDGAVDELFDTCGVGACEREVRVCVNGASVRCAGGEPEREVCNGVDDDCDGRTDEALAAVCGVGACEREAPVCVDGAPVRCEPRPPSAEACDGVDSDCDGVDDAADGVCPGCVRVGGRAELAQWPAADVASLGFDLAVRDSAVFVAWRDGEALVVTGCDPDAQFVGRRSYPVEGPRVAGPRWTEDPAGEVHLLHEWTRADADGVEVRRLSHLSIDGQVLDDPVEVLDRVTCREEPLVRVESRVDAPRVEVVGLAEACDFAEVEVRVAALTGGRWRQAVHPLEVQAGSATVCGAWRLPGPNGRGILGIVTTAVSDDERANGVLGWRLDVLDPQLEWSRVLDPEGDPDAALVDARGCPFLAVVDDALVRVTLNRDQTPRVARAQLDPDGRWQRAAVVPIEPGGVDARGAYLAGTFRARQVGPSGWAAAWLERAADGPVLQMSTHAGLRGTVRGCAALAADSVEIVPAARPLVVWQGGAEAGVDGADAILHAVFAGSDAEQCSGIALGAARGATDLVAVPAAARGEAVNLYWLSRDGALATLRRARLEPGSLRARPEVVAERLDVHANPPFVVRRRADGTHHVVFATRSDDNRLVLEYRALQPQ